MSDARWIDVDDDIASATRHFARSVEIFERGGFAGQELQAYIARMALMQAMQAGYSSLERALERIFDVLGEEKPTGRNYHADLLRRSARPLPGDRPAILREDLVEAADEARRFRHVARRTYDDFRVEGARPAIEAAGLLRDELARAISMFRAAIDPDRT